MSVAQLAKFKIEPECETVKVTPLTEVQVSHKGSLNLRQEVPNNKINEYIVYSDTSRSRIQPGNVTSMYHDPQTKQRKRPCLANHESNYVLMNK